MGNSVTSTTNSGLPHITPQPRSIAGDLSGICRLGTDAVHKTAEVVEAQHSRLDWLSGYLFRDRGADKVRNPIAAVVYNSIYSINSIVGSTMEYSVTQLEPLLGDVVAPTHRLETAIAILNGVVGDYLHAQRNPLQIHMHWRTLSSDEEGGRTDTTSAGMRTSSSIAHRRKKHYLLLIHGSCNSPLDWRQEGHNHGIAIANELDMEPLFLHYNTGLHISKNGKLLSQSIQRLVDDQRILINDTTVEEDVGMIRISIIAHSMGGLVARSACYYATQEGPPSQQQASSLASWIHHLDHLITLGTPHHGAILERGGKLVDAVLGAHRFTEPISWLTKIRSAGVMDLGYGNIRDEDWSCHEEDGNRHMALFDTRQPTPLPPVSCLAVAAVLGEANLSSNLLLGASLRTDGLVTEASALGIGHTSNAALNLVFEDSITLYNLGHLGLLSSQDVYKAMLCFLAA
jgi:hypothetical protein